MTGTDKSQTGKTQAEINAEWEEFLRDPVGSVWMSEEEKQQLIARWPGERELPIDEPTAFEREMLDTLKDILAVLRDIRGTPF